MDVRGAEGVAVESLEELASSACFVLVMFMQDHGRGTYHR
jgi:hypothetical protein